MRTRISIPLLALAATLLFSASASAAMVGIYRNGLDTLEQRSQLVKLSGRDCQRGGSGEALRILVGKRTEACSYRTPVVGRDLEIAARLRLLSETPASVQHKAFVAVELRAGGGAKYQLAVFPRQRKLQLRKILPGGEVKYLRIARDAQAIAGVDMANVVRLQAINVTSGPEQGLTRLFAYVGPKLLAETVDAGAGELKGRASAVAVGALRNGNGVVASVDDVVIRVPSPFDA